MSHYATEVCKCPLFFIICSVPPDSCQFSRIFAFRNHMSIAAESCGSPHAPMTTASGYLLFHNCPNAQCGSQRPRSVRRWLEPSLSGCCLQLTEGLDRFQYRLSALVDRRIRAPSALNIMKHLFVFLAY